MMVFVKFQRVDFLISTAIAKMQKVTDTFVDATKIFIILGFLMNSPYAIIVPAGLSLPLFSYKLASA